MWKWAPVWVAEIMTGAEGGRRGWREKYREEVRWNRWKCAALCRLGHLPLSVSSIKSVMRMDEHESSCASHLFLCMFVHVCVYLLSCWAWRIQVHIHWRRRMSWWRLCGPKGRLEPRHTSLWREDEYEDPGREIHEKEKERAGEGENGTVWKKKKGGEKKDRKWWTLVYIYIN